MGEQQEKYITDAAEMLGAGYHEPAAIIEEPRRRKVMGQLPGFDEQDTAAWVKLSTAFKPHIKALKGAPLAVWLYLSLSINRNGQAFPGIRTMAEELDYSHQGIIDAVKTLEEKGYLAVRRGERRYNLYEPGFAAIGRGKEPVNSVDSLADESTFPANESTFSPNESSGLDLNKRNKIKQEPKKDLIDAMLEIGQMPGAKKQLVKEYIAEKIQSKLGLNPSGRDAESFIDYAAGEHKKGKSFEIFLEWWLEKHPDPTFWSFRSMEQKYPLAFFVKPEPAPVIVAQVDESQYVPNPYAHARRG